MKRVMIIAGLSLFTICSATADDLVTARGGGSLSIKTPVSHVNQKSSSQSSPVSEAEQRHRATLQGDLTALDQERRYWLQRMVTAQTGAEKAIAKEKVRENSRKRGEVMGTSIRAEDAAQPK
jgi:hypothetical protein